MVIVEYCPFGNIQHFLIKHRSVFQDHFAEKDDILNDKSRYTRDPSIKSRAKKNENGYVRRASQMGNSYTGNEVKRSLSTTDLICWAYQVF